jgi:putative colanic acid biosynthesis UDP-glucose lipid carrier transferase
MVKNYRSHGGNSRRVIILGAGSVANEVYSQLVTNISYGYKFLGFFDDRAVADYKVKPELVVGKLGAVNDFIENNDVEEIYCALPAGDDRKAVPIIHFAEQNLVRCFLIPDFKRFIRKKVSLSFMEEIPVISMRTEPLLKFGNQVEKRIFDLVVSTIFLITIFPLLLVFLGLGIKLTSKGPIFFKQKRTGENGIDFYCYKFRTMCVNQDADSKQATKDDSRVTKIGAFMRKTNLDEMPQFFNVFIGNMSIVGPRPHMLKHTEMYSKLIDQYMIRHFAKPGITGWAQVTGFRGETQRLEEMEGRVKRDVWYIENWSFFLDVRIIFMTVFNMFRGDKNAY